MATTEMTELTTEQILIEELNRQIWSFTEAMTEAIDARTPYNASHTRKVAEYVDLIIDNMNAAHARGEEEVFFDEEHKSQIRMAALLHDIGKIVIPVGVMNKSTRLEKRIDDIAKRIENIELRLQIDLLKGDITDKEYQKMCERTKSTMEIAHMVDNAELLDDSLIGQVSLIQDYEYVSPDGNTVIPFLTEEEKACMNVSIGTLTAEERAIMESHVVMTERILSKVHFNKAFKMAPIWAAQHHEYIDGSGYPNGISGDDLCIEARILAVADICDALLATDRPYKKPMTTENAFATMEAMVREGKIEGRLVEYLKLSLL